jgi:hypothetical protein
LMRGLAGVEGRLVLSVCELGLSVRSRAERADLAGVGFWASLRDHDMPDRVAGGRTFDEAHDQTVPRGWTRPAD